MRKRLTMLLAIGVMAGCLILPGSVRQHAAESCVPPPECCSCIELLVYVEQNCRCECPDQACCDFYNSTYEGWGCPKSSSNSVAQLGDKIDPLIWRLGRVGKKEDRS
jgi:hypothetical protein